MLNTYSPVTAGVLTTGTFANRVPGQPLYSVDLNCHCYDPNKTYVLNPAAWVDPGAGQYGTSPAFYSDFRSQRRPVENMNFGRTWSVKERYSFALRVEFTNIFNRAYWSNPTTSNVKASKTTNSLGNNAAGFGFINATAPGQPNTAPRNGVLVGRFTPSEALFVGQVSQTCGRLPNRPASVEACRMPFEKADLAIRRRLGSLPHNASEVEVTRGYRLR